jgi:hypothetical protein
MPGSGDGLLLARKVTTSFQQNFSLEKVVYADQMRSMCSCFIQCVVYIYNLEGRSQQ